MSKQIRTAGVPYGFRYVVTHQVAHEPVPEEQEVLRMITDLRNQRATHGTIARELNKAGFRTRRNTLFTKHRVGSLSRMQRRRDKVAQQEKAATPNADLKAPKTTG